MSSKLLKRGIAGLACGVILVPSFATSYNTDLIADYPLQAERFVNAMTGATSRAMELGRTPGASKAINNLETYYNNQLNNFLAAVDRNLEKFGALDQLVTEATAPNPNGHSINSCLNDSDHRGSWGVFTNAVSDMAQLKKYVSASVEGQQQTSLGNGYFAIDRRGMNSDVQASFGKVGKYLVDKPNTGLYADINGCCTKLGAGASDLPICNPDHVKELLAPLANLERLPSQFVDPLNAGSLAGSMTREDLLTMLSLGQMNDLVQARDFNEQVAAMRKAESTCQYARTDALNKLGHEGQIHGLVQTGIQTVHCGLWSVAQNWGKAGRSLALGLTKASFPIYNTVSQCPAEIQDQAALALSYTPQQFQNDYATLGTLPGNITYSSAVAQPIAVEASGTGVALELRDEGGFTQNRMVIDGTTLSTAAPRTLASSARVSNATSLNAVRTGTTPVVRGRAIVNGTGATTGNGERVAVRKLATKSSEGNLEATRTLVGAVKSRVQGMKSTVAQMKTDSTRSAKSLVRANAARQVATTGTALTVASNVTKAFKANYSGASRVMADELSGRDVERPTTTTTVGRTTSTSTGVSSTTSTVKTNASYADAQAAAAYKKVLDQRALAGMITSIKTMAQGIDTVATKLNEIIAQKRSLIDQFRSEFDPSRRFQELGNLGADDRSNKLVTLNQEWAREVKEINSLNTQELGLRTAIQTSTNSLQNYIAGATAFQGLTVSNNAVQTPGLANGQLSVPTVGSLGLNPYQPVQVGPGGAAAAQQINAMPNFQAPQGTAAVDASKFWNIFQSWIVPSAVAAQARTDLLRSKLLRSWDDFTHQYERYSDGLQTSATQTKQKMWERYILNERENRQGHYLTDEGRVIVGTFNSAVHEELPDLIQMKNLPRSGVNPQVYSYIEELRRSSIELNDLVSEEARLTLDQRTMNPAEDENSWTGQLPAEALQ